MQPRFGKLMIHTHLMDRCPFKQKNKTYEKKNIPPPPSFSNDYTWKTDMDTALPLDSINTYSLLSTFPTNLSVHTACVNCME